MKLSRIADLLNKCDKESGLKFLNNLQKQVQGQQTNLKIKNPLYQFEVDTSQRKERNRQCSIKYRETLLELNFSQQNIDFVLLQYSNNEFLPSFNEVLDQMYKLPRLVALQGNDFENLDIQYQDGIPQPNQLQDKILQHIFQLEEPIEALMVLATGLGKTYLSMFVVKHYFDPKQDIVLFLVNSTFIKDQTYLKYQQYFGQDLQYLNIQPDNLITYKNQQFIFCLFQSLHHLSDSLLGQINILIIDEVHHVLAPTYLQKLQQFKHLKLKIGLTATLTHQDDIHGTKIKELFGNNLVVNLPWFVAKNLQLFPELNMAVQDMAHNFFVFSLQESIQKAIIFLSNVQEVVIFAQTLQQIDGDVNVYEAHYKVDKQVLQSNIQSFKSVQQKCCLITVGMATEGYDLPDIDCVLMGRQTESERLFVQQMGRCLRKKKGKLCVYVLDMCGNLRNRWIRLAQEDGIQSVQQCIEEFWEVIGIQ